MTPDEAFDKLRPHLNAWGQKEGKDEVLEILRGVYLSGPPMPQAIPYPKDYKRGRLTLTASLEVEPKP